MFFIIRLKKFIYGLTVICVLIAFTFVFILSPRIEEVQQPVAEPEQVELPVLMYHDVFQNTSRLGEHAISPAEFEADLQYLQEKGYQSVTIYDVINYVEKGTPLPEKPVLLTFDDGHFNNIYYAEPLLKEYNMQAAMFVVGAYSEKSVEEGDDENPNYTYVTWERLKKMAEEDVWDIQSHSWDMHEAESPRKGMLQRYNESEEEYIRALQADITKITQTLDEITGVTPIAFAYPYGFYNDTAEQVLKEMGYKITLSCRDGIAVLEKGNIESLFLMKRLNRGTGQSIGSLLDWK